MKKLQRLLALISAFSIVLSILVVSAEINYDKNNGYDVGEGVMVSSTQMFNDGLVSDSGSNVKYDTGSSKKGTITFDGDSSDKRVESVTKIFGKQYKYDGVIDYAGSGKGKDTLKLTINILTEKNYYAYVMVPAAKDIFMWVDDTTASTAGGSKGYKTSEFAVEGVGGYVYAIDCGVLSSGVHTLTFDGAAGAWLPDICAVAIYPTEPVEFLYPYQNEALSFEERAADLVSRMTLEEKCAQLGHNSPAIPRLGVHAYYYWREGAHGVVDQGKATSFPVSLSISNSWDPEMYNREAKIISTEARVKDIRYNLNYWSPTVNMSRDPRWGRNNETFGEDPYLTTQFGTQFVNGMQGADDNTKYLKTISTLKHFLANNCEYERQTGSSEMDEQTLRDYYSKAFKNIVESARPGAVMSSYNATTVTRNGEKLWDYLAQPANGNILTTLLRRNWGFDGFVTGDCGAVADLNGPAFKRALFPDAENLSDVPQAATVAKAIQAGNELDCGNVSTKYALEAVKSGYMSEDDLELALYRVFLERFKTGEFDNTDVYRDYTEDNDLETDANVAVAEEAAAKGIVMLQNTEDENGNTILPISKDRDLNIALVGEMASQTYIGDYSGTPTKNSSPYDGLKEMFGENNVHFLGHADDNTVLFNIKSMTLVLKDGKERTVDLSKAEKVTGMSASNGSFTNVTPVASAVIPNIDFSDVVSVKTEMATGTTSPGGTVVIGYGNPSQIEAKINSERTDSLDTYAVCEGKYTGADGDYDGTADMWITIAANSTFELDNYKEALNEADVIIAYSGTMVGGAEPETGLVADGHESNDRTTISLPYRDRHVANICNAKDQNGNYLYSDKTVVVMQTVGEVDVRPFKDHCRAILWNSYNGQRQGIALAKVISGEFNPSGKLTSTWYDPEDLKIMTCGGVHTKDDEGITWKRNDYGIRQRYDENGNCVWPGRTYMYYNGAPQYNFGYGLSYTDFKYSNLELDKNSVDANGEITASIDITNIGTVEGTEIAQLYVQNENGDGINLPLQQLAGFDRVDLKSGETKNITFKINIKDLEQYSEKTEKNYVPTGKYNLWVGKNVTDKENITSFTVDGVLKSEIKTVYTVPTGVSLYGAFDSVSNTTASINSITSELSVTMSDEEILDMSKADVRYESSDNSIAQVTENGVVTAGVKSGVTTITAHVTVNGQTESVSFPVVCKLQPAIPSEIRQKCLDDLDKAYSGYNKEDYREIFWTELTNIYNNARQSITDELVEEQLEVILNDAVKNMAAIRRTLKPGEPAYSVTLTNGWYWDTDANITYLGDEDSPAAKVITAIYNSDGTLKNTDIKDCAAKIGTDDSFSIENLLEGETVSCYIWNDMSSMTPMSNTASTLIEKPPAHVEYNLDDSKYARYSAMMDSEPMEEINGFGGFGNFNDISGVNYTHTYNGKTYKLTGGLQGGKGSYTKSCLYFKPFDCYTKATVTALFDSAGEERSLRIKQKDASGNEIVNVSNGGIGNKKIVEVTAEITDLSQPVYIMPTVKESVYMIIVDYE